MEELKVDPRWSVIEGYSTFAGFTERILPKTELLLTVDQGIKDYYNVIKKLLYHSYYEYEFVTVALRNCLPLVEYSFNHYYTKHTGEKYKGTLAKLIRWFEKEKLFDAEDISVINLIRHIRNHYMHPKTNVVAPPAVIGIIDLIASMINDLEMRTRNIGFIK